jgi:hypothetical protein
MKLIGKCFILISLFLFCFYLIGVSTSVPTPSGGGEKAVTCQMNGFNGFPKKITGPVVFELKRTVTIAVFSKDKAERVDITFPRDKCK